MYCLPSCAARRPLRQNVRFYATGAEAEAAGFRACKRSRPNAPAGDNDHTGKIAASCRLIETAETTPTLDALAAHAGLSPYHFHRVFKATTGVTPKAYAVAHRRKRISEALQEGKSVTAAIYEAGFNSSGRFYADAMQSLGMKPGAYRAGGADVEIRHATAACSLGLMLVAATDKGVCAIFFGDDAGELERELRDRFPRAKLAGSDGTFAKLVAQVIAFVEAPQKGLALPLDVRGTAFQQQVWAALREIPPGETATYGEIARRIGKPAAVRAVGTACGANRIAVAIPCHRVVGIDGKLTGYRWGVQRKRSLLDREKYKA
ncbi:MAG: bifunctional DNA-binding transcriptional regulator/O6-methylguanine-DNA methyltransferase Ada [Hyphomicrobium sp.]|nr:bifunctional DNA-binding transcriptional regulator/O6-methylguanine-DNA methyltransferase Ada [Hyphomicrobium sp.]